MRFLLLVRVFITDLKRERKNCKKEEPQLRELRVEALDWSEWRDLNPRPLAPQTSALPAAPHPDNKIYFTTIVKILQYFFYIFLKKF